jgi:hypothetical protein
MSRNFQLVFAALTHFEEGLSDETILLLLPLPLPPPPLLLIMIIIMMLMIIHFNSILVYLHAILIAQRPITKLTRVHRKKQQKTYLVFLSQFI